MKTNIGVAICSIIQADNAFQVLPSGLFRASDGRPEGIAGWQVLNPQKLLATLAQRKNDYLIDYEHQILAAATNGKPAPAAGWLRPTSFEWRADGLFALAPKWTAAAKTHIDGDEYRYISPVFQYLPDTGEVINLLHIGLTNDPALDGMLGVAAAAAARFGETIQEDTPPVKPETLAMLGLPANATEQQIEVAIATLQQKTAAPPENTDVQQGLAALSAKFDSFIQAQEQTNRSALIAANAAKLPTPELRDWAAKTDTATLTAFLSAAAPIAALSGTQTDGKAPETNGTPKLTPEEQAACKALGLTEAEFDKGRI